MRDRSTATEWAASAEVHLDQMEDSWGSYRAISGWFWRSDV